MIGSFETTITVPSHYDPDQSEDISVDVTVRYTATAGTPGRLSGPPEDCYPAEAPEVEITSVKSTDHEYDYHMDLSESDQNSIMDRAIEDAIDEDNRDCDDD